LQDGELHAIPNSYDVDFDIRDLKAHFGNLFNGNKLLGELLRNGTIWGPIMQKILTC
jgi:hypothetical protein